MRILSAERIAILEESDIVVARQRAGQLAKHIGMGLVDQTKIATATSELARTKTRGAAVALARFDSRARTLKYVAVGNIESRICTDETSQGCATLNGTAGLTLPRLVQFEYPVPPGALFIMHTDGLSTRWNLRDYPGLNFQSPGAVAGVLFRDFARKRDDSSILVFAT